MADFSTSQRMLIKGELQEAEAACRRILHSSPSDAAATHLLGLIIHQQMTENGTGLLTAEQVWENNHLVEFLYNGTLPFVVPPAGHPMPQPASTVNNVNHGTWADWIPYP
jgi:hypothetical protein